MSNLLPEHDHPLEEFLEGLHHLSIDIARLKPEAGYEEKRGGYCDLQVAILDHEIPGASKLVAAKKLLLGTRSSDPKRLAFRLARELKVWAGLRHPHVLPLLGFYVGDNYKTAVLISEYMVHGDLNDYIARMKPSYDERLHLVRDLTDGLAYLHTQTAPVRHGDLKPGNVLVNLQHRALLSDFGLSKALDTNPTGFTTGNDVRGTMRFSSPEVLLQGVAAQSLANDMWSWGCLVLEGMTDQPPFADILPEPQLILALAQGRSPCDMENLALHPPQLKDLLAKCWSTHPNRRPTAVDCLDVVQDTLLSLAPATTTRATVEQLDCERPQSLANGRVTQHQPLRPHPLEEHRQTPTLPLGTQSPQALQAPSHSGQQYQSGPFIMPMGFHAFFTRAFSDWSKERQPTPDLARLDGERVELSNLFLIVGALGGWRAVSEKRLWQVVGEEIGFLSFIVPMPVSRPEVAEQLSKIYVDILADFEAQWHTSLSPRDPNSIFPLPPQLQHLHPEIERLATTLVLWRQQQQPFSRLVEAGPQQPMGSNAIGTRRPGLGVGISNGQPFTGSPLGPISGPTIAGPHPFPHISQVEPSQGLRNYLQERGQHPQEEGGPAARTPEGSEMVYGIEPNQAPIQPTWQFIDAGHQGRRAGTLGGQVGGGSRPGVGMRSSRAGGPHMPPGPQAPPAPEISGPQQPGGQGSPFTVPVPGPPAGCPGSIPPQILIQAMRTIGLTDRAQESLSLEEWNNIHIFLRAVIRPQRQLGMATTRISSGGNPIIPGASEPGSSGPQRRVQGPNFPQQQQHLPAPEEMMGQLVPRAVKRPGSPSMASIITI